MDASGTRHVNPLCFCCGSENPMSFGLELQSAGEREIIGHARVDHRHEGARGTLHGGAITALFDEVLGGVAEHMEVTAATATLTVDFRGPVTLPGDVEIRAWCEQQEGRKLFMRGELRTGEVLAAEAHGMWIVLPRAAD